MRADAWVAKRQNVGNKVMGAVFMFQRQSDIAHQMADRVLGAWRENDYAWLRDPKIITEAEYEALSGPVSLPVAPRANRRRKATSRRAFPAKNRRTSRPAKRTSRKTR